MAFHGVVTRSLWDALVGGWVVFEHELPGVVCLDEVLHVLGHLLGVPESGVVGVGRCGDGHALRVLVPCKRIKLCGGMQAAFGWLVLF